MGCGYFFVRINLCCKNYIMKVNEGMIIMEKEKSDFSDKLSQVVGALDFESAQVDETKVALMSMGMMETPAEIEEKQDVVDEVVDYMILTEKDCIVINNEPHPDVMKHLYIEKFGTHIRYVPKKKIVVGTDSLIKTDTDELAFNYITQVTPYDGDIEDIGRDVLVENTAFVSVLHAISERTYSYDKPPLHNTKTHKCISDQKNKDRNYFIMENSEYENIKMNIINIIKKIKNEFENAKTVISNTNKKSILIRLDSPFGDILNIEYFGNFQLLVSDIVYHGHINHVAMDKEHASYNIFIANNRDIQRIFNRIDDVRYDVNRNDANMSFRLAKIQK